MLLRGLFPFLLMLFRQEGEAHARVTAIEASAGLPDKYITSIQKDARGLMWVGTRGGLCTFDGVRFGPAPQAGRGSAAVSKILYSPAADQLWAATDAGIYAMQCRELTARFIPGAAPWSRGAVSDICLLQDGRLLVAYQSGEIAVTGAGGPLRLVTRLAQQPGLRTYASGLAPINGDAVAFRIAAHPQILSLASGAVRLDTADEHGPLAFFRHGFGDTLLIGRAGGGLEARLRSTAAPLFPALVAPLARLRDVTDVRFVTPTSFYVLCKQSALYAFDAARAQIDTFGSPVFAGKLGTCLFVDAEGIVWMGTNKGLVKVTRDRRLFRPMLAGQPPVSVRSLAADERGALYAGTYSGLFVRAPGSAVWQRRAGEVPYAMQNMPGRYLYFVGEQPKLFRLDKETMRVETDFYRAQALPSDGLRSAYTITADARGALWIGTSYGVVSYDPSTAILAAHRVKGLPPNTAVSNIRPARNGAFWLGTRAGLYEWSPQRGTAWHIGTDTKPVLPAAAVNFVDEDSAGRLWLCTDGGGLAIVSADRKSVTALKTDAGLSDNTTYQLLWQGGERAWISTFNGLSSYHPRTGTFYNFYAEDGLTTNEFNHNAFLALPSGEMLFGGISGLNAFHPDSIPGAAKAARLFVSGIQKWDDRAGAFTQASPADTAAPIVLRPLDHSLTFYLALSDYDNPDAQIFHYRIQGLFDKWVSLGSNRTLRLDGLAAGRYLLEIRATDSRGTPAVNRLRYRIRVEQAFYKSFGFYLLLFLAASALLSAFFVLRVRHIRRVQRLREQIASDLHDEVGSLLTRITMTSDNLQYARNSEEESLGKLQKIAALSRSAASSMSDILWAIDARNDYTGNLADRMREHAEEMLAPLDVQPLFDFAVNQRMQIASDLRQQLYLIFKEAVNNIVKHSRAGSVRIRYHHDESGFVLRIANDGGVESARASSKGQGLKNMRMRAGKVGAQAAAQRVGEEFVVEVKGR